MNKKNFFLSILLVSTIQSTFAYSNLCVKMDASSAWGGGVFSVINSAGLTVATTTFIMSGNQGCTYNITPGEYVVRFSGFQNLPSIASDEISGCVSDNYLFKDEEVVNMVFSDGSPPFNNNKDCRVTD